MTSQGLPSTNPATQLRAGVSGALCGERPDQRLRNNCFLYCGLIAADLKKESKTNTKKTALPEELEKAKIIKERILNENMHTNL